MTREAYDQVMNAPHRAKLSHELIAAAAAYEAAKLWNEHQARNGVEVNHAKAKEFMAAAAGFFIDRMIETKGLDAIDSHRARQHAYQYTDNYHPYQYSDNYHPYQYADNYHHHHDHHNHGHHHHHHHHGHHF